MKAIYAILILFSLFLISCVKDSGPTSVEGRVLEQGSNKPIPFAEVSLLREKREILGAGVWGVGNPQTVKADANGKFSLHFEANEDYSYSVNAEAVGYYSSSNTWVNIERGKKNKKDIFLPGYGYLKYHIKNVTNKYHIGFSFTCFNSGYFTENTDTIIICQDNGNVTREIIYMLTSTSAISDTIVRRQNVFIPTHDTASITIEY